MCNDDLARRGDCEFQNEVVAGVWKLRTPEIKDTLRHPDGTQVVQKHSHVSYSEFHLRALPKQNVFIFKDQGDRKSDLEAPSTHS